jgi:hypothetical protein
MVGQHAKERLRWLHGCGKAVRGARVRAAAGHGLSLCWRIYISRCPMPLEGLHCQVSTCTLVNSDACPHPTTGRRPAGAALVREVLPV